MKKTIISLVLLLIAVCGWAQKVWETPRSFYDKRPTCNLKVTKVDFANEETIVHLTVETIPHYWFLFVKETYLIAPDGKHYLITGGKATRDGESDYAVGEKFDPANANTDIALHFEPLPADVERFHLIEGPNDRAFKIWNITDSKTKEISDLFDSNWRNDQTGDWQLGLYADNAVYNSKIWKYESKDEKKVVLTDGQEKVTINIGKEKNGKRQFTINGQKLTLARFNGALPDYPMADNTPYNTELVKGEATIVGWIKDFPKEIKDKDIDLLFRTYNNVTGIPSNINIKVDETGMFTAKIPMFGTADVLVQESLGNDKMYSGRMVLQPGKSYTLIHDWTRNTSICMGEDARLQNELMANPCEVPYIEESHGRMGGKALRKFENECMEKLNKTNEKLNEIIAQNPNISKRYRDYVTESNRFRVGYALWSTWYSVSGYNLPDPYVAKASKLGTINPDMPLSLTNNLGMYIFFSTSYGNQKMRKNYRDYPDLYFSYEQKGMLKLSDKDRDILNKWKARKEEEARNDTLRGEAYRAFYNAMNEKYCSYEEINLLRDREDMKDVYNKWAPSELKQSIMVVDSIYTDENLRDFNRARALAQYIRNTKQPLSVEGLAFLNDVKNSVYKEAVDELNEATIKEIKEKAAKADKRIFSASIVEGLEDGKAILDKIVGQYKGKIVYLDVWGVGCGGCMTYLQQASPYIKYQLKDYDIVYLYLATETNEENWKYYITEFNLISPNCVHYNLPRKQFYAVENYIGETGIPAFRLFDKEGNMIKLALNHYANMEGFKKQIDELSKK
jgi:hypothetical protein